MPHALVTIAARILPHPRSTVAANFRQENFNALFTIGLNSLASRVQLPYLRPRTSANFYDVCHTGSNDDLRNPRSRLCARNHGDPLAIKETPPVTAGGLGLQPLFTTKPTHCMAEVRGHS